MKKLVTLISVLLIIGIANSQDNEKRIQFNNGTLKICSNSHMKITGYDGDEVIIKNLNNQSRYSYFYNLNTKNKGEHKPKDSILVRSYNIFSSQNKKKELEKGLKPLGNKSTNPADNLYLDITVNPGELIIKDHESNQNTLEEKYDLLSQDNKYELLIPNTIKLLWNTENCAKKNSNTFFIKTDPNPWQLSDFKGEVEISTTYTSISLTDVSGPVIANTIGGNIKVVFDNTPPTSLYSLVSNDGYIDVTLPLKAEVSIDANGNSILSNIDFTVLNESIDKGTKAMELKLNSGKVKMKLDAGSGSVYLRKFE